jgi:hypothetical protein
MIDNMSYRFIVGIILLVLLAAPETRAQSTGDGSIYSAFGIGELTSYGSSQNRALGGGGFGLRTLNYANFANPAALSNQVLTRLAVGVDFQGVQISDAQDNVSHLNQGSLAALQLSFPLLEQRLGVAFGIEPYSRVSYRIRREGQLTEPDTLNYGIDSEGRGGLQMISGGLGYSISPAFSVGARVGYLFGILEAGRRTFFAGGEHQNVEVMNQTRLGGVKASFGAQLVLDGPRSNNDQISAGVTFALPTTLTGDRFRTLGLSLDRDTLGTLTEGEIKLPWAVDAGVAYRLDTRWIFVIDGSFSPWTDFESTFAFNGYEDDAGSTMRDRIRISAGAEFTPAGGDPLATFFGRSSYRLGVYTDRSYVDPSLDYDLVTYALTGGISLPALLSGTRLDVNGEVGTRGTTEHGLVRDVFYRVSASINIGERWFERRRLR